ncbi:hypothetical protein SAMN04487897_102672 [Paenibacillus sp. yr247]|uniref:hypothetical protein n=1 Tax=Paenibacillus sp. yr247 TaxID=1761880 RepID=UPI000884A985|nr:hypothetical protein [Paenibacillus sp. yr247]SDN37127.1 hypothetical protein SAMN04487897_102672 [Paenibacillus sp. yr247]
MKKENLISAMELNALLAENGEDIQKIELDEPMGSQHLISLQKAVVLLSEQVAELQSQLHEHFEIHNKQQEQLLRQFKFQMENKLYEQILNRVVVQQSTDNDETIELQDSHKVQSQLKLYSDLPVEEPPTYSRVKSYGKIRKRKKGFLEKLFE